MSTREAVDPAVLDRMCAALEHRGPDSRGVFVDPGVGLAVQRLAVIDLERGDQPLRNEDGSLVLVANGEIYNYLELREQLSGRGHRFATDSDSEVILHLYEQEGDECVQSLRGMFAFALWDRRRRRLLLARDRVGKKPLFYSQDAHRFWFASEARSILQDEAVPRDFDPAAIDTYLHYQYVAAPRSAFSALRKLPPAHLLIYEDGRLTTRRYWKLSFAPRLRSMAEPELEELIRERLTEATALRLRSDVPVGALISGGIDSSAVLAAFARQARGPLKTFSIGFDVAEFDERQPARALAQLFGAEHHELLLGADALDLMPRLVLHYGEPFADPSAVPCFHLAELARRHVTVALAGDGGDESFAGYDRYRRVVDYQDAKLAALRPRKRDRSFLAFYDHLLAWGYFGRAERQDMFTADFLAHAGSGPAQVTAEFYRESDAPERMGRILDVDLQTYLAQDILVKMDIASMAHSLEVRSPLLDHVFLETVAAIPTDRKIAGGAQKRIFKQALRDWLPDEVLDRPKWGFAVPLCEWFRGDRRALLADVLLDPVSLQRGIVKPGAVRQLIDEHLDGTWDHSGRLWALLLLELWLREFVDRRPDVGAASTPASPLV